MARAACFIEGCISCTHFLVFVRNFGGRRDFDARQARRADIGAVLLRNDGGCRPFHGQIRRRVRDLTRIRLQYGALGRFLVLRPQRVHHCLQLP